MHSDRPPSGFWPGECLMVEAARRIGRAAGSIGVSPVSKEHIAPPGRGCSPNFLGSEVRIHLHVR